MTAFKEVDVSGCPDIHLLPDDLDVALWILLVGSEKLGLHAMSSAEIATVATLGFRRPLTRQRVAGMFGNAKDFVASSSRRGPAKFVLMRRGIERIQGQASVVIVDPTAAFTALLRFEEILEAVEGEVLICDPYISDRTLVVLGSIPKPCSIKLLTLNISDPQQFRRKLDAYQAEYGNLELRVSPTPDLHDRYLLDATEMWLVGQSLNGIGKKHGFIVKVGADVRKATDTAFRKRWNNATRWVSA